MSQPGGLNQFLTVPMPPGNGDGPVFDVSTLVAGKTFFLSGNFNGLYTILGSHDDERFTPVLFFQGGQGPQSIQRQLFASLKSIMIRRNADAPAVVNLSAQLVCHC